MIPSNFNWTTYLILNPDVARVDCSSTFAQFHWLNHGQKEGRSYQSLRVNFNWKFYTSFYPDLNHLTTEETALYHYIFHGINEERFMNRNLKLSPELKSSIRLTSPPNSTNSTNSPTNDTAVILFMNARDENNLEEWVAYHLLIGFDRIVIFDHLSKIPITTTFQKYHLPQVEIHRINTENINKIQFMKMAYNIARNKNATWILYLDADEYLALRHHHEIHRFIRDYATLNSIGINWVMFGSNYHDTNPSPFIIDNFIKCSSNGESNKHVKALARIDAIDPTNPVMSPHYWTLKPGLTMHTTNKNPMPLGPFNQSSQGIRDPAYIHHYHFQSYNSYIQRKVQRVQDDKTQPRPLLSKEHFHAQFNQHTETYLRDQYSNRIKQFLKEFKINP
jgi:hypothetical protein